MLSGASSDDVKSVPLDWCVKLSGRVARGWRQAELQRAPPPASCRNTQLIAAVGKTLFLSHQSGMRRPHRKQTPLRSGSGSDSPVMELKIYKQALWGSGGCGRAAGELVLRLGRCT